jgi:hypothetical protein
MELQEWQKLTDDRKSSYSEELAANLPQPVIFRGLQLYHYNDRTSPIIFPATSLYTVSHQARSAVQCLSEDS